MAEDNPVRPALGPSRRIDVELLIAHPTMSVAEISAALGLEAHFAHSVGEERSTPKGTILQGRYRDTRWRYSVRYLLNDQWFAGEIEALIQLLMPHKAFLHHVRASGGTTQVIVQFLGDGYLADSVPVGTIAMIAELQLDFGIECFSVPQS